MQKIFFQVQSTRLADPFEPLNIFLVQWAEELGRWLGNRKLVFFCENRQNQPDAKVLMFFGPNLRTRNAKNPFGPFKVPKCNQKTAKLKKKLCHLNGSCWSGRLGKYADVSKK